MNSRIKRFVALSLALALAFVTVPVESQDVFNSAVRRVAEAKRVLRGIGAVSTEVPIIVRYVGTNANGGTVAVAAGGDLTFSQGAVGSSTADATVKCPSGGSSGVIDVSDTACDTLGEVVDILNATSNWRAVILEGLRADSSNNTLITLSETAANTIDGLGLLHDGTVSFKGTILVNSDDARSMKFYVDPTRRQGTGIKAKPFAGQSAIALLLRSTSTYGSGTSSLEVICVDVTNGATGASETSTKYVTAAGATTVATTLDFTPYGLGCPVGQKMLWRTNNSEAMTVFTGYAAGLVY